MIRRQQAHYQVSKKNFLALASAIVVAAILSASVLFFVVPTLEATKTITRTTTVTSTITLSWEVVKPNITVDQPAAGIPCGVFGYISCMPFPVQAVLIKFNGTYYYVTYVSVNNVRDNVLYDNSTTFCVSPKIRLEMTCPWRNLESCSTPSG